ncbi:MAG: aminopeptidase P family protein, partial [Candidatus Bipolaricaulota bacterium]
KTCKLENLCHNNLIMNNKIEKLRNFLEEGCEDRDKVDGYLLLNLESSDRSNQRYLTGFDSSLGCLIVLKDRVFFLTDSRYIDAAKEELSGLKLEKIDSKPVETTAEMVNNLEIGSIAIDQNDVSLALFNKLSDQLEEIEIVQLDGALGEIRREKEKEEIELHEKAARIADDAFSRLLDFVEVGMTENEIALELEFFMRNNGAEDISFPPIVASGEKSALPHAKPGDDEVSRDELLLVDMGAKYEGYCSDLTRTIYFGDPPTKVREIYEIVLEAQRVGLDELGPGVSCKEVHQKASTVIEEGGYGDNFGHGLGHGVGLDVHEGPRLSKTSDDTLKPGNVVTVEPGIYLPGWGGIRIEDMVRITEDGYELFSHAPKNQIINPLQ